MTEERTSQFSLRATIVLTAAIALWLAIFREASPVELAIFSTVTLAAGVIAHLVHAYWLPWRFTVIVVVLLIYNTALAVLMLVELGGAFPLLLLLETVIQIISQPAKMAVRASGMRDILFTLGYVLGTLCFTPAHVIRPGFPTAIITAIGIGIWYTAGILIMIYAG